MFRRCFWVLGVAVLLAAPAVVRAQGDYLDVFVVKVKPEKLADFEALAKKWAEANRRFNGGNYLAMETMYGEGDVYMFVGTRRDYADLEKVQEASMSAVNKAFGKEATQKLIRDFESCLAWSRAEFRRRRWDLSTKAPTDPAAYGKLIGESRVLRTTAIHIRPGHVSDFEALLKEIKEANERASNTQPVLVSQVVEGSKGPTFYITGLRGSLGGFDKNPTLREILGEERFAAYRKVNAEAVESSESSLLHFSPELSNPPEEIVAAAPDYWRPKAAVAAASKPKPAAGNELKPAAATAKPKQ